VEQPVVAKGPFDIPIIVAYSGFAGNEPDFGVNYIVCSTKNSLAASHDKSEVCLSTRCEMNY
jgi:hypothetical protein